MSGTSLKKSLNSKQGWSQRGTSSLQFPKTYGSSQILKRKRDLCEAKISWAAKDMTLKHTQRHIKVIFCKKNPLRMIVEWLSLMSIWKSLIILGTFYPQSILISTAVKIDPPPFIKKHLPKSKARPRIVVFRAFLCYWFGGITID